MFVRNIDSNIHNVFHFSQLKPFLADYTPDYSDLPATTDIQAVETTPEQLLDRRLVKKGNTTIPQVLVKWAGITEASTTWEDYNVLRAKFLDAAAWGQAGSSAGGDVRTTASTE